jgi:predicted metal-dependent hydrolase
VIAHEVCHLKHFNHSSAFWDLVKSLDPSFKDHHRWLRTHGDSLLAYFADEKCSGIYSNSRDVF